MLKQRKLFSNRRNSQTGDKGIPCENCKGLANIHALGAIRELLRGPDFRIVDQFDGLVRQGYMTVAEAECHLWRGIEFDLIAINGGGRGAKI